MMNIAKNHKRGIILLPLILLVILGALVLILSLKIESNTTDLERINQHTLWLDLHLKSVKEHLKTLLKQNQLTQVHFTKVSLQIGDYSYIAILKKAENTLAQDQHNFAYYFVDIFGIYSDSQKEFLQEFSVRRSFVLCLEE